MRGALALAALALAAAALPAVAGDYHVGVGLSLLMYVALTQSWTVLSGMTGYVSLGHVVFYGLGAYVAVLLWGEAPLAAIVALAALAAFAFAALIGLPALRVRGPYFVILTFGLAELAKYVVIVVEGWLGKFSRVIFGAPDIETLYYIMFGLAAAATLMTFLVRRSRFGRGLLALRENEEAAETVGVPTVRFKLLAYALSALVPGAVGSVMVLRQTYFEPAQIFDPVVSFTIVTMAVVGGSEDMKGPLLGAAGFVLLSELLWANAPQLYMVLLGLLLIVFVLFAPQGLSGLFPARRKTP
ncbi:MAG: branched-chain amino acid ABC transporter permease [Alphaproteobacteria bacterium]